MDIIRHKPILCVSLCFVLCLIIGLGVVNREHIKNQLNSWKLLPQPERLTELYFTSPNNLPSTYTSDESQVIKFTTHNLEYQSEDYHYTITEVGVDNEMVTLRAGSFRLAQNQYEKTSQSVNIADLGKRVQVAVTLTNANESVDYWLNRIGS